MTNEPASFRETVQLRDESQVELRPVVPADAVGLQALFTRLSPESVYLRFLGVRKELPLEQARRFASVDYQSSMAILAVVPDEEGPERIVGVARYGSSPGADDEAADVAVVVEDAYQGRGLGTILLIRLVKYARDRGVRALHATVHQSNAAILHFLEKSGLPTERTLEGGVWNIVVNVENLDDLPEV